MFEPDIEKIRRESWRLPQSLGAGRAYARAISHLEDPPVRNLTEVLDGRHLYVPVYIRALKTF